MDSLGEGDLANAAAVGAVFISKESVLLFEMYCKRDEFCSQHIILGGK